MISCQIHCEHGATRTVYERLSSKFDLRKILDSSHCAFPDPNMSFVRSTRQTARRLVSPSPSHVFLFSTSSRVYQTSWDEDDSSSSPPPRRPSWSAPIQTRRPDQRKPMPRVIHHVKGPTPEELEKRRLMRIQRAERLERKDLTAQMTETKTCELHPVVTTERKDLVTDD